MQYEHFRPLDSQSIRHLKEDFGCVQFRKVGKRMLPTDAALTFIEYGKRIETLMDEVRGSVNGSCYRERSRFVIWES